MFHHESRVVCLVESWLSATSAFGTPVLASGARQLLESLQGSLATKPRNASVDLLAGHDATSTHFAAHSHM